MLAIMAFLAFLKLPIMPKMSKVPAPLYAYLFMLFSSFIPNTIRVYPAPTLCIHTPINYGFMTGSYRIFTEGFLIFLSYILLLRSQE